MWASGLSLGAQYFLSQVDSEVSPEGFPHFYCPLCHPGFLQCGQMLAFKCWNSSKVHMVPPGGLSNAGSAVSVPHLLAYWLHLSAILLGITLAVPNCCLLGSGFVYLLDRITAKARACFALPCPRVPEVRGMIQLHVHWVSISKASQQQTTDLLPAYWFLKQLQN